MTEYVGKVCPFCKTAFREGDEIVVCSDCDMPHHKDCWIENQGCTTFGCMGSIKTADRSITTVTANRMNYEDEDPGEQVVFCTKCGKKNDGSYFYCGSCGAPLTTNGTQAAAAHSFAPASTDGAELRAYPARQFQGTQQTPYNGGGYPENPVVTIEPEVVQLIGTKAGYYVPAFQALKSQNHMISWNWLAFLFTPYWLIYRKMYGYGAGVLAGSFIVFLLNSPFLSLLLLIGYAASGVFANYVYMNYLESKAKHAGMMMEPYREQYIAQNAGVNPVMTAVAVVGYLLLVIIFS